MTEQKPFSDDLRQQVAPFWTQLAQTRIFKGLLGDQLLRKELLQLYLIESYHYVKHNAQHQALAVWQKDARDREFMRKALQHAIEEVDHDVLALRDLEKMGIPREKVERSIPLPETLGFTGYLYYAVTRENPVGRLGYSFWAENVNQMGGPMLIARVKQKFGVADDKHLSFFAAHAALDMRHGDEAIENIDRFAVTPEDKHAVSVVAHTTMKLFIGLVEAVYDRYLKVLDGAPLLNELPFDASPGRFRI